MPKLKLNHYQRKVRFRDVPEGKRREIVEAILDHLGLDIIEEATPDYVAYELRKRNET